MKKRQTLNFLKNNRALNKGKMNMKSMLNLNNIKTKEKNKDIKFKNIPIDKLLSMKNNSFKKINEIDKKEKNNNNKILVTKKRNYSYIPNFHTNNCTINNNINYSNNNNINFNMINNNININSNKILTKKNIKYDFNKNKIRKKMMLSELNPNLYNTNLTSLNNDISKITGDDNISSYFEINNRNKIIEKQNKNNSNKNILKYNDKYLTSNNSYHCEENKNKTKIILINYPNFKRNNRLSNNTNAQTQINLHLRLKQNKKYPKRKFNNSQTNIIMNNMKKSFYTTFLYNGLYNSKNDIDKKFIYNSNNTTLNKNSKNKKYFNLTRDNSLLNLTGSFNSQKHLFTEGINFIFDNNDNDLNFKKIMKKNKSSFLENKLMTNTGDIHLKSVKDLKANKFIENMNNIQLDLENKLNLNKNNDSNIKKYKILKNSFNNFLKLLNQTLFRNTFNIITKFLEKIYSGYNDIFASFSSENKKLNKINNNLKKKKNIIEKKYNDLEKLIKEKQEKLKSIEQKFQTLLNYVNKNKNLKDYSISLDKDFTLKAKSLDEGEIILTTDDINKDIKNGHIYKMNKNNLNDLDALYFFDKIKMTPQRTYSEIGMPNLNLIKKLKNGKKGDITKNKIGIINISDIKFTSNYFNKFKQALEKDE